MLFSNFVNCSSLLEVAGAMFGLKGKTKHFQLKNIPHKRKGGIKVHTQINLHEKVPKLIWFSAATTHDKQFLKHVKLD